MSRRPRGPLWSAVAAGSAAVVALVGVLAGCQRSSSTLAHPPASSAAAHSSVPAVPAATLAVSPADGSTAVALSQLVTVTASGGTLTDVSVHGSDGAAVPGAPGSSAAAWVTSGSLAPSTTYTVNATAVNAVGQPTTLTASFTTLTPTKVLGVKIAPLEGETVGVGMPIVVYFTAPVTDRAAVEQRLKVDESMPVLGAWHWYSSTEVHYRPAVYWPAGEHVTVHADMDGVDAGNGVWGVSDHTVDFRVGDSHITRVDAKTDVMTVQVNGRTVKTAPVSLGRDKYPTTSGIHVVLEKTPSIVMDSATVGIPKGNPDYYYETVLWDVRISWSGEFVHSAPWSVADQGHENVSHGCVNASPADAEWFYNLSRRGDIVEIVNTPRKLVSGNGWTDWNMSWNDWLAGSAIDTGSGATNSSATRSTTSAAPKTAPKSSATGTTAPGTTAPGTTAPGTTAPSTSASKTASPSGSASASGSGSPTATSSSAQRSGSPTPTRS